MTTSEARPRSPPAPVPERTRTWWAYSTYVVFALGGILILLTVYLIFTDPGLFRYDLPGALLGVAAFLIGLAILDRFPRDVDVGPEGVEFDYLLSHIKLTWGQLAGPVRVGKGFVAFRAAGGTKGVWGLLTVTDEQARTILSHPSCPAFELPDEVATELRQP